MKIFGKEIKLKPIEYYRPRYNVIIIGSALISLVVFAYFLILTMNGIIEINTKDAPSIFNPLINFWWGIMLSFLFLIFLFNFFGGNKEPVEIAGNVLYNPSEFKSLVLLIISTILFVLLAAIPILFLGGAQISCFGSMLITMCGLIVVVTNSKGIRITFMIICLVIYWFSSFYFVPIIIKDDNFFRISYNLVMILTVLITFFLTWKGKTMFEFGKNSEPKG
ncbi:MAG: hypothetical protein WC209_10120 [Ignavibacteriaceae bacterium]|jgi:hypothetical protein